MAAKSSKKQKALPLDLATIIDLSARFTPPIKITENGVDRVRGELHLGFDNGRRLILRANGTWDLEAD